MAKKKMSDRRKWKEFIDSLSPEAIEALHEINTIADPEQRRDAFLNALNEGARYCDPPYKLVREGDGFRILPLRLN